MGAKRRISNMQGRNIFRFLLTDCLNTDKVHVIDRTVELITSVAQNPPTSYALSYRVKDEFSQSAYKMIKNSGYDKYELIALCTNTKNPLKDWNAKDAAEFIRLVNKSGRRVVWVGTSNSLQMAEDVESEIGKVFLNLINKTDISTLGGVLDNSKALVSVDTGTMHIGVAMKKPVVALFFRKDQFERWAPKDSSFTKVILDESGISGTEAFCQLENLLR